LISRHRSRALHAQFAAAPRDRVERRAAPPDVEPGRDGAREQQGAGFELVVQGTDEAAKLRDRVAELQFLQIPGGVPGEHAVGALGDFAQK